MIHNETNPYNARRLVQWHDGRRSLQPAGIADLAGRDGPDLRPALHAAAASRLHRADSRLTR